MSRTAHHRSQRATHCGYDYGGKYRCNRGYGGGYGRHGRNVAHREMRADAKIIIKNELVQHRDDKHRALMERFK